MVALRKNGKKEKLKIKVLSFHRNGNKIKPIFQKN